mmetsp:Transcript_1088/g.1518  ORF Transcript_1088/g.1518 Transcript_1088/m.1518 type:complete len:122 (+) Transcript_1088:1745-2110(+)
MDRQGDAESPFRAVNSPSNFRGKTPTKTLDFYGQISAGARKDLPRVRLVVGGIYSESFERVSISGPMKWSGAPDCSSLNSLASEAVVYSLGPSQYILWPVILPIATLTRTVGFADSNSSPC